MDVLTDYGYVMATDRQALSGPNTTFLSSPNVELFTKHCLQFSYKMSGIDPGEFAVFRFTDGHYRYVIREYMCTCMHLTSKCVCIHV